MRSRASAAAAWTAVAALVGACKASAPEATEGGAWAASSAGPGAASAVKTISHDDCTRWAAHAVEVLVTDWKASAAGCAEAERTALAEHLDGVVVSIRTGAETLCASHLGETYTARDGQCFADAKSYAAMTACKFAPMTSAGDSDMEAAFADQREKCRKERAPAAHPGGTAL